MDKIQLGINLRNKRKEKNITLKELSQGICSLGKMSNIENGMTEITDKEIELFCERLGITFDELIPLNQRIFLNKLEFKVGQIINSIFLGFYDYSNIQIEELENMLEKDSSKIPFHYVKALLLFKQKEYRAAIFNLYKSMSNTPYNDLELQLQSKSYNLTGAIYYHLGDINSSHEMFQKALDVLDDKLEKDKVFFNLAILYASKGNTTDSRIMLTKISDKVFSNDPKIQYLQTILDTIEGDKINSLDKVIAIRKRFIERDDKDSVIRSLLFYVYMYEHCPSLLNDFILETEGFIKSYINNIENLSGIEETFLYLVQSIIAIEIKNKETNKVSDLMDIADQLANQFPYLPIRYYTYFLKAKFLEITSPNKIEQKKWLQRALDSFNSEVQSLFKGIIYFELAKLDEEKEKSYYQLASEEFYESYLYKPSNTMQLMYILPKLYIH